MSRVSIQSLSSEQSVQTVHTFPTSKGAQRCTAVSRRSVGGALLRCAVTAECGAVLWRRGSPPGQPDPHDEAGAAGGLAGGGGGREGSGAATLA